jgi:tetratricopeptide (TPR) repeat protein
VATRRRDDGGRWFEPEYGEPPADSAALVSLGTPEEAQAWLETEGANWLAALRSVAADGLRSRVVEVAGAMHWFSDRWTHWGHWREVFELSRDAARAMGDRRAEATHLNYLAWTLDACEGRSQESVNCSLEAYALALEEGDIRQRGWALAYAASSAGRLPGSSERAAKYAREAAELLATAGDWDGYPQAVMLLGDCMHNLGRPDQAIELNTTLLRTLRDPSYGASPNVRRLSTGLLLLRLGGNHAALGHWKEAAERRREAIGFLRSQGRTAAASEAARGLGAALRELGRTVPAREALEEALAGYVSVGDDERAAEVRREIIALDAPAPDRRSVRSDPRERS